MDSLRMRETFSLASVSTAFRSDCAPPLISQGRKRDPALFCACAKNAVVDTSRGKARRGAARP